MKKLIISLALSILAIQAQAQSLKFYGTNGNTAFRLWLLGNPCAPTNVAGTGVQYVSDGTNWQAYLATVTWTTNLGLVTYRYNSHTYNGPTNSFTITSCVPETPPLIPYSIEAIGDDLGVFVFTLPVE